VAIALVGIGLFTASLWLGQDVPALLAGQVPGDVVEAGAHNDRGGSTSHSASRSRLFCRSTSACWRPIGRQRLVVFSKARSSLARWLLRLAAYRPGRPAWHATCFTWGHLIAPSRRSRARETDSWRVK
jgi:hypothetical protein